MFRWDDFKYKLKYPSPDKLARIEYRSHFLQMLGVLGVCIILISKGFWYVIFALIFSIGVSYSQGMGAYQKYQMIKSVTSEIPIDQEKSLTRRIDKIIREVFGKYANWFAIVVSAILPAIILPKMFFILYSITYLLFIVFLYILIYYNLIYLIALTIYKLKHERGYKENG